MTSGQSTSVTIVRSPRHMRTCVCRQAWGRGYSLAYRSLYTCADTQKAGCRVYVIGHCAGRHLGLGGFWFLLGHEGAPGSTPTD